MQSTDAKQMSGLCCKCTGHSEAEVARSVSGESHSWTCALPASLLPRSLGSQALCTSPEAQGPKAGCQDPVPVMAGGVPVVDAPGTKVCLLPVPTPMAHPHAFTMELIFCSLLISFSTGFP